VTSQFSKSVLPKENRKAVELNREGFESHYDQEPLHIAFDVQYLLEFLRAVGGRTSNRMQVKDAASAAEFRPSGDDGEKSRYVLMPLRLY
jgi:DNA polymerase III sliding clamp (beta) subunit (PCNA family)